MIEIKLHDKEWLRGEVGNSFLLRSSDQRKCCIGVACTLFGVSNDLLLEVEAPGRLDKSKIPSELSFLVENPNVYGDSKVTEWLMEANDSPGMTDQERVDELNKYVEPFGIKFVFVEN